MKRVRGSCGGFCYSWWTCRSVYSCVWNVHFKRQCQCVINILHDDKLGMSKVSSWWVPRMLSPLQKLSHVEICRENLSLDPSWRRLGKFLFMYCNWEWDVSSLLGSWHKAGVDAVEAQDISGTNQISHSVICTQNHGNCVLGLQWNSACGIHASQIHCHCRCVCEHNEVFERSNQRKTSWFIDSRRNVAAWQCTRSQVEESSDCYSGVWVSGDEPSTLQPDLAYPVTTFCSDIWRSTCEDADFQVRHTHTHTQSGGCFIVAAGPRSQLLPGRNIITLSKVEQVHRTQGRPS